MISIAKNIIDAQDLISTIAREEMLTKVLVAPYANAKRAVATCSLGDGLRFHIARWPAFTHCEFPSKALEPSSNVMPDTKDFPFPVVW